MRRMSLQCTISLLLWIVAFQVLAGLSAQYGAPGLWYQDLVKSPLTPPGYVFGIVWTFLYTLLAVYGWGLWQVNTYKRDQDVVRFFFLLQMFINYTWSPVFFGLGMVMIALIMIFAMIMLTAYLAYYSFVYDDVCGYLLLPYIGWLTFAGYLTAYILWFYPTV